MAAYGHTDTQGLTAAELGRINKAVQITQQIFIEPDSSA